jgi:hypothetical protein
MNRCHRWRTARVAQILVYPSSAVACAATASQNWRVNASFLLRTTRDGGSFASIPIRSASRSATALARLASSASNRANASRRSAVGSVCLVAAWASGPWRRSGRGTAGTAAPSSFASRDTLLACATAVASATFAASAAAYCAIRSRRCALKGPVSFDSQTGHRFGSGQERSETTRFACS